MRVPYIINKNTLTAYIPSAQTQEILGEADRQCFAEDFEWDKDHCPTLEDCCVQAIAKHYEVCIEFETLYIVGKIIELLKENPILEELPCFDRLHLLDILPSDLPLECVIPRINDEHYWKRRYEEVFKFTWRKKPSSWTWKSQYLERHCQKIVEEAQPQYYDEETFDEILTLCNPYVTRLFVEQLQMWKPPLTMEKEDIPEVWPLDHINMGVIFKKLNNIQEFDLIFGMKNVGEDFKWEMFKMSVADCTRLGKAIQELPCLKILRIHRSQLGFQHIQTLVHGLLHYAPLEELDLSHCNLGDTGALCIAYLLKEGTNLKSLNLTNNGIRKIGAEGIGFAILQGKCRELVELSVRLNPLGTEGVMGLFRAFVRCSIPTKLSIATCMFDDDTPIKLCQMLKLNETLKRIDVSCNYIGEEIGDMLVQSVAVNTCIEWLDVRETDISQAQREQINEYLVRNRKADSVEEKTKKDEVEIEEYNFVFQ